MTGRATLNYDWVRQWLKALDLTQEELVRGVGGASVD